MGKMASSREPDWDPHRRDIKRALLKVGRQGAPRGPHLPEHGLARCGNPGQPSWATPPLAFGRGSQPWAVEPGWMGMTCPCIFPLALSGPSATPNFYCLDLKGSYLVKSFIPALPSFTLFPLLSPETGSCIHSFTKW